MRHRPHSGRAPNPNPLESAITGGESAVRARLASRGRAITNQHASINAVRTTLLAEDLAALVDDPAVLSVSLDAVVTAHQTAAGADSIVTLDMVRADVGSSATPLTGRGVGVAVIDSGLQNVHALRARINYPN